MGFWWWVLVFGGIAVVALGLFAVLGLRLWRRAKVLLAELARMSSAVTTLETAFGPAAPDAAPKWEPEPVAIGRHRAN